MNLNPQSINQFQRYLKSSQEYNIGQVALNLFNIAYNDHKKNGFLNENSKLLINACGIILEPIWPTYCKLRVNDGEVERVMKKQMGDWFTLHHKVRNWTPPINFICLSYLFCFLQQIDANMTSVMFENLQCVQFKWIQFVVCIAEISKSYFDEFKYSGNSKCKEANDIFIKVLHILIKEINGCPCTCTTKHCFNELNIIIQLLTLEIDSRTNSLDLLYLATFYEVMQ